MKKYRKLCSSLNPQLNMKNKNVSIIKDSKLLEMCMIITLCGQRSSPPFIPLRERSPGHVDHTSSLKTLTAAALSPLNRPHRYTVRVKSFKMK